MNDLRDLYPPSTARESGWMEVGGGHRVFWEAHGNPVGIPLLHLCGGPGGAPGRQDPRFFNPMAYRIVLIHPRGAGRSTPAASVEHNTMDDQISDIEQLRTLLNIERWIISGSSWGTTLALAYAQTHRQRIRALLLRGVFLCTADELQWLYGGGAGRRHPEAWARFSGWTGAAGRQGLLQAYAKALNCGIREEEYEAAYRWCAWENHLAGFRDQERDTGPGAKKQELAMARISAHYFLNEGFLSPDQLISNANKLHGIHGVLIHGTCDEVTPMGVYPLTHAWKDSVFHPIEGGTHVSIDHPRMIDCIIRNSCRLMSL
ncbi:alpha/beta fold hydrolase [Paraburkholderia tagetis]|uniref:Proline iminopeptidase n=1 Tax=Paraburkholderia tagetis TaxID=2913261 RepID=A0A9X1RPF3_9BURK|nr:alpha/beta fold hydrolase [Paraburkholderia tagetis]MCG5074850.1 alpha/beta fold hydrolase [Paraburkholderia tagetis]